MAKILDNVSASSRPLREANLQKRQTYRDENCGGGGSQQQADMRPWSGLSSKGQAIILILPHFQTVAVR